MVTIAPGRGTPEPTWSAWPLLQALPALDLADCRRAVVLAPHPDDETLAVGGVLAALLARGVDVDLLCATDGEGSHPDSRTVTPERLREVRVAETDAAGRAIGEGLPGRLSCTRWGLPDGGLSDCEDELEAALASLLRPGDWCLAPLATDGHPDHDAAGRAAATACAGGQVRLLAYPLWAWHWARPGDPRVPWPRAVRFDLAADALRRKSEAIDCYPSQTEPLGPDPEDAAVVPPSDLAHFRRPYEVLFA